MQYKSKQYYEAEKEFNKLSDSEKEKAKQQSKEIGNYLQKHITILLPIILNNGNGHPPMSFIMGLGSVCRDFCEKFECTPLDFIEYLKIFGDSIKNNMGIETHSYGSHFKKPKNKKRKKNNIMANEKKDTKSNIGNDQLNKLKNIKENL